MSALLYMSGETIEETARRVQSEKTILEDNDNKNAEQLARLEYLTTVEASIDQVIDFLNGEYIAFKEKSAPTHSDREVFNST